MLSSGWWFDVLLTAVVGVLFFICTIPVYGFREGLAFALSISPLAFVVSSTAREVIVSSLSWFPGFLRFILAAWAAVSLAPLPVVILLYPPSLVLSVLPFSLVFFLASFIGWFLLRPRGVLTLFLDRRGST